jgi:hypothetical protein
VGQIDIDSANHPERASEGLHWNRNLPQQASG